MIPYVYSIYDFKILISQTTLVMLQAKAENSYYSANAELDSLVRTSACLCCAKIVVYTS
jgi:hypothetical protein